MTHPSPLNLKTYGIESFAFKADLGFEGSFDIDNASIKIDKTHLINPENELVRCVKLKIEIKSKKKGAFPYSVKLDIIGFFDIDKKFFEKDRGRIADINGSSILYGAAREFIFLATAHGRYGPLMLPVRSFIPPPSKKE